MDLKSFYRRIEACFGGLGEARTPTRLGNRLGPALIEHLGGPLAVAAVHLYTDRGEGWSVTGRWGPSRPDLSHAMRDLAGGGPAPWVLETAAGRAGVLSIGTGEGPVLALFGFHPGELRAGPTRSEFSSALHSLQHAVHQHLQRGELETALEQARAIQRSLLPKEHPSFPGFELFAASVPASDVCGDLFDYVAVDSDALALVVADATGHGFPAALQARDVAMGVRMGVERDLKLTRLVEKLNRIIHRSGLVTRFVSMVFGELEANGNFTYVNAGHPPALLLGDGGVQELAVGGPLLGPLGDARYKLGFAHVDRGAALALYSDGAVECRGPDGAEFGVEGLAAWLADSRDRPAESSVNDLLDRLRSHRGPGRPLEDDVTVMLVRRPRG